MPEERLQKIISRAGVSSRRKAEELILAGQVTVNGEVITELGSKADLDRDHIKVNGKLLHQPKHLVYLALNKPRECVTTVSDPQGRKTVMDLVKGVKERVYPVGRLDYHSEGLLLMTNDGEFANAITSAKNRVPKTYVVKVNGSMAAEQEQEFRSGVPLHGKRTAPAGLKRISSGDNPWYEVKLIEGRQNQIRLMFQFFGLLVERLRRVQIGYLKLDVKPGEFRHLSIEEVERFWRAIRRPAPSVDFAMEHTREEQRVAKRTPFSVRRGKPAIKKKSTRRKREG
jgi:23S rRNA pseudouridine2605 synthase